MHAPRDNISRKGKSLTPIYIYIYIAPMRDAGMSLESSGCEYGWRNNLVYTFAGGVRWIFAPFWILYGSFGGPEWSHWIDSTFRFQIAWFSARKVEYGSSSDRFSWLCTFSEKLPCSFLKPLTFGCVASGVFFFLRKMAPRCLKWHGYH